MHRQPRLDAPGALHHVMCRGIWVVPGTFLKKEKETLRLSLKLPNLRSLARQIATEEGLEEYDLRSGSRKRDVVRAKRLLC